MLWVTYGILHSLMRAVFAETGRVFRVDGEQQAFWQAVIGLVVLIPFALWAPWPHAPGFYVAAAGMSLILTSGALINLGLSSQRKGRELGVHVPLETFIALILWLAITPAALGLYTGKPALPVLVALAFMLASTGLLLMRPRIADGRVFCFVASIGISYAVAGVVTKTVIPPFGLFSLAIIYATVNFAVMSVTMGLFLLLRKKLNAGLRDPVLIKAGAIAGLSSAVSYVAFVMSVARAPNPGYTSMLAMLVPVWLLLWHRARRVPDEARALPALLVVIGIAVLIAAVFCFEPR